jgi:hypothetical protein
MRELEEVLGVRRARRLFKTFERAFRYVERALRSSRFNREYDVLADSFWSSVAPALLDLSLAVHQSSVRRGSFIEL